MRTEQALTSSATAEQVVEARHDAVAAHADPIGLGGASRRPGGHSVDVGAPAEIGMHELEPERDLTRDLEVDAGAERPAVMHGRALRHHAECVVLYGRLDVAGGEAAFDVGQPVVERVADPTGDRTEPGEL